MYVESFGERECTLQGPAQEEDESDLYLSQALRYRAEESLVELYWDNYPPTIFNLRGMSRH